MAELTRKQEAPLRRQSYWEAQVEEAWESDDPRRAALAVYYRWIVSETKRQRTGRAQQMADHALGILLEAMEHCAQKYINIDCSE